MKEGDEIRGKEERERERDDHTLRNSFRAHQRGRSCEGTWNGETFSLFYLSLITSTFHLSLYSNSSLTVRKSKKYTNYITHVNVSSLSDLTERWRSVREEKMTGKRWVREENQKERGVDDETWWWWWVKDLSFLSFSLSVHLFSPSLSLTISFTLLISWNKL